MKLSHTPSISLLVIGNASINCSKELGRLRYRALASCLVEKAGIHRLTNLHSEFIESFKFNFTKGIWGLKKTRKLFLW